MDYQIYNEDCLEGMKRIADGSVDMILTDLPYNLTDCAWDKGVIDLPTLWTEFNRVLKPCCSAVLFASGKFTHKLIASNFERYKYKWIWCKNAPTMVVQAKNAPMRKFEEILVFSDGSINHPTCTTRRMKYNPQGVVPCGEAVPYAAHTSDVSLQGGKLKHNGNHNTYGDRPSRPPRPKNPAAYYDQPPQLRAGGRGERWRQNNVGWYIQEQTGYPTDLLEFKVVPSGKRDHPTQKPVDLLEYLIRTYTNDGELVLDATMGSGSTGVACMTTGRKFIGFETDEKFYAISKARIDEAISQRHQRLF